MSTVEQVLSTTDPGDDMQRRLRYQAAYGALLCLDLVADDQVSEIFCEHHEDFLLKKVNGGYIGVQVKTRLPGEGPFKTTDEPVKNAFTRFVSLEKAFPGQFVRFVLVANCDFYDVGEAETNLRHVLEKLRSKPKTTFTGSMNDLIEILRMANACPKTTVRSVLAKSYLFGTAPKFEDMEGAVVEKAARLHPEIVEYRAVAECAKALIDRVYKASALTCDDPMRTCYIAADAPAQAEKEAIVAHKRITASDISAVFSASLSTMLVGLPGGNILPSGVPVGTHIMERKMAAGGISAMTIGISKDHQASAEYALQEWIGRYGPEIAIKRRNHIDLAVRTRCVEAQDQTASHETPYGAAMMDVVRTKLQELATDEKHVLGLKYEHLLGFVSLATQACKVWWSDIFDIGGNDASI